MQPCSPRAVEDETLAPSKSNRQCLGLGQLVGLRVVAGAPERFARVVAGNAALPAGRGDAPAEAANLTCGTTSVAPRCALPTCDYEQCQKDRRAQRQTQPRSENALIPRRQSDDSTSHSPVMVSGLRSTAHSRCGELESEVLVCNLFTNCCHALRSLGRVCTRPIADRDQLLATLFSTASRPDG